MKKISELSIAVDDPTQLNEAIDAVEGKASERLVDAALVGVMVETIEERLSGLLYRKDWRGLAFDLDWNAQRFARAYTHTPRVGAPPLSTQLRVELTGKGWRVTRIERACCGAARISPVNIGERGDQMAEFNAQPRVWE